MATPPGGGVIAKAIHKVRQIFPKSLYVLFHAQSGTLSAHGYFYLYEDLKNCFTKSVFFCS